MVRLNLLHYNNVLYVSSLAFNLISVFKAVEHGLNVHFDNTKAKIVNDTNDLLCSFLKRGNLFVLDGTAGEDTERVSLVVTTHQ